MISERKFGLDYENESRALNENFSDIFGEMVERYKTGKIDWLIGEGSSLVASTGYMPGDPVEHAPGGLETGGRSTRESRRTRAVTRGGDAVSAE